MPYKRSYKNTRRVAAKKYKTSVAIANKSARTIQAAVRRAISQNVEIKSSIRSSTDGQEIPHNGFVIRSNNLLATTQGLGDLENGLQGNRIGDKINILKLSIVMMLELNERYSVGTFKIFVIKSAKGDAPTDATFFTNVSGNRMIDTINYERFSVLAQKTVVIKQSSYGKDPSGVQTIGSGFATGNDTVSRATKIVRMSIKGSKFQGKKPLQYENNSGQPKFHDYHLLVFSYSNFSTTTIYNVGRVNDEVISLAYRDG